MKHLLVRATRSASPILLLFIAPCTVATQNSPVKDLPGLVSRLESLRRDYKIPGMSAAIVKGQAVAWSQGFGQADVAHGVAAADTTSYHLASLTKTFASTIVMQLVEAGQLDLESPVADFGIVLPSSGIIRVKHLLTHTSEGTPGATFSYNGNRFGELDRVIQRVTGESFAERVERIILQPLQLRHTAPNLLSPVDFHRSGLDSAAFQRNLAQGYSSDGRTPIAYPNYFGTAAGLMASALDVAQYSIAIDANRFLTAETQARVFTPAVSTQGGTLPYGLGWFVQSYQGVRLQWHYGLWIGNSSLIIRVPERQLAFVLLANSERLSAGTSLGAGELLSSPFAKAFLDGFVFGTATLPQ